MNRTQIILITGNMAAGKSSVAQALTERLPKSVHHGFCAGKMMQVDLASDSI